MKKTDIALSCVALLAANAAHARQAAPAREEKPIATVEVKANADTLRRNDTASRIVVTHEELVKYGDASVLDVLKRLPGVTVSGSAVRMRGLGSGYTQVLVNGERPPAGFSLDALSPESIEKIEVIRAATAEYSTQSVAGTINVILKKLAAKRSRELKLNAGGSRGGRTSGAMVSVADRAGRADYLLAANVAHNDSAWTTHTLKSVRGGDGALAELRATEAANRNLSTNANLTARVTWAFGAGNSLSWQAFTFASRSRGSADSRTATAAGPAWPYPIGQARYHFENGSGRSDLNWVARFDNGGKLDTKVGGYLSRNDRGLHWRGMDNAFEPLLDRRADTTLHNRGASWTGKYSIPLLEGHALAVGWDAGGSSTAQADVQVQTPIGAHAGTAFAAATEFVASIRQLALYAQDEWDVAPQWSMYLGARWEGVRLAVTGSGLDGIGSRYGVFSPLMQTLWKMPGTHGGQLRFALTRTYRAPELYRLVPRRFYTTPNSVLAPDYAGNPDLKPELATGVDVAYEHYFGGGAMVSVSAASRQIENFIRDGMRFDGGRWEMLPTNRGKAHSRSLELEAKLPLKAIASSAPALDLRASVSRNWSRVDEVPGPDNRLDRQPAWSANLGADYKNGALTTGASFSFVTGGWTRSSQAESSYGSARRDLEAYVLYKLGAHGQLRLAAVNLLQPETVSVTRYRDALAHEEATTTGTWRSARLQYEYKF